MGTSRLGWETHGLKRLSLRVGGGLRVVLLPGSLLWAPRKAARSSPCPRWTSFTSPQPTVSLLVSSRPLLDRSRLVTRFHVSTLSLVIPRWAFLPRGPRVLVTPGPSQHVLCILPGVIPPGYSCPAFLLGLVAWRHGHGKLNIRYASPFLISFCNINLTAT